jgi:CheY-like chemotaxis protein
MMKGKVLVVEDDADVREMMQLFLEAQGYDVLHAQNGAAALDLLRSHADEVALILLDVLMPVMDGWAFLEKRALDPVLKRLPTVVVSATHPVHPMAAEASGFLGKPISPEALLAVVSQHVGRPGSAPAM